MPSRKSPEPLSSELRPDGQKKHILLTGATGLLGNYLLRDLLLKREPVAAIARPRNGDSSRDRIEQLIQYWEKELRQELPRPVCFEGDITQEGLGLDHEVRRWFARNCGFVLHNAASLTFEDQPDRDKDPWLTNLTGTKNVLEFCDDAEIRNLHYMSTAYVCGKRDGTVLESDVNSSEEFNNPYEESKFEAEQLVRQDSNLEDPTIYRPAIIVGDSKTGYTTTYHALYTYLRFVSILQQGADADEHGRWHLPDRIRLNLTGEEHRNLVPVEWVSAVTTSLIRNTLARGKTYHLAPADPVTARELEEAFAQYFKYYENDVSFRKDGEVVLENDYNDFERAFFTYMEKYNPYWAKEPVLDCKNTLAMAPEHPCPRLDGEVLHRLIDYAVKNRFGRNRKRKK